MSLNSKFKTKNNIDKINSAFEPKVLFRSKEVFKIASVHQQLARAARANYSFCLFTTLILYNISILFCRE